MDWELCGKEELQILFLVSGLPGHHAGIRSGAYCRVLRGSEDQIIAPIFHSQCNFSSFGCDFDCFRLLSLGVSRVPVLQKCHHKLVLQGHLGFGGWKLAQ